MKFRKSATSPTRIIRVSSTIRSFSAGHIDFGTYARDAAEHFWPWYSNAPRTSATASAVGSALVWAKTKSFPPVSPTRRGYVRYRSMFSPTLRQIHRNTGVEPVKCRSEEHTSELQSQFHLVCRLLLEKKKN